MRFTLSQGFVQSVLTWAVLERRLLAHPQLSAEFVASLRKQVPAVSRLSAKRLTEIGATGEQRRSTLVVVRQARSEVQASRKPPLATLMGRSRGWAHGSRVKTYLTLLWQHQRGQINVDEVFDHVGVDRRSVNQALRDLADLRFVDLVECRDRAARHDVPGDQPVQVRGRSLELLSDLGTGDAYQRPAPGEFFQFGDELWTDGWMARMPGQGLAVLLVLLSRVDSRNPTGPIWVASSQVKNFYGFSDRVWSNGVRYLRSARLVTLHHQGGPDVTSDQSDRRKFYAPAGLTHPWLVPAKSDPKAEQDAETKPADTPTGGSTIPDGAHVLYLKQDRRLNTEFINAIKELRVDYEAADDPVEQYKYAREIVMFAAEQLEEEPDKAGTALRRWAQVQIDHTPHYCRATPHRPLPAHEGYRHLVNLLEQDGEHDAALQLAKEAKEQGWGRTRPGPDSWNATIVRLEREVRRRIIEERVGTYTEDEILSTHEGQQLDNQQLTEESDPAFREAVKQLRVEYEIADSMVEKFDRARSMVLFAARQRTERPKEADTLLRAWARIQIDLAEHYLKTKKGKRRWVHEGYRYLVDLLEADGQVEEALRLAQEAKQRGWGRTRRDLTSWDKTIKRLDRELRRRSEADRLSRLPDGDLYAPRTSTE